MKDDPATIAASLTERQRKALIAAPRIGGNNPGREFTSLLDLGLGDCTIKGDNDGERWVFVPSPLGLAVRQHLQDNQHD